MAFQMNTYELCLAEVNLHLQQLGFTPIEQPNPTAGRILNVSVLIILIVVFGGWLLYGLYCLVESLVN